MTFKEAKKAIEDGKEVESKYGVVKFTPVALAYAKTVDRPEKIWCALDAAGAVFNIRYLWVSI